MNSTSTYSHKQLQLTLKLIQVYLYTAGILCKYCFYNYRTKRQVVCNHHTEQDRVSVKWNGNDGRYETTGLSIRSFPEKWPNHVIYVAMCDPHAYKGWCNGDMCTYAHGRAEQKAWNMILRQQRQQQDTSMVSLKHAWVFNVSCVTLKYNIV